MPFASPQTKRKKRKIVDIVLDIMEDGPRPMKNLKPTEKNRNCVDQFWDAHQAEYEARSRWSEDGADRANQHSLTYPRLRDELEKRRSLSKVETSPKRYIPSSQSCDRTCDACVKLRLLSDLRNMNIKPKCKQKTGKTKARSRDIKSRMRKGKHRPQRTARNRMPISIDHVNTRCRCAQLKHKMVGHDWGNYNMESGREYALSKERMNTKEDTQKNERMSCQMTDAFEGNKMKEDERSGQSSINTYKNPDTSVASMSSYNSYLSVTHEPMVGN